MVEPNELLWCTFDPTELQIIDATIGPHIGYEQCEIESIFFLVFKNVFWVFFSAEII